jgi:hypothetical protein
MQPALKNIFQFSQQWKADVLAFIQFGHLGAHTLLTICDT